MNKSIAEISVDSHAVYVRITQLKPGEIVLYSELSSLIGRDFQLYGRGNLETAERIALRDDKMVFASVRNVGVKRLENEEIPFVVGGGTITKIRRAARRCGKKIIAADYDALSNDGKIRHNTGLSVLGAFVQMTRPKAIAKIDSAVELEALNRLTFAKTLEQFKQS